MNSDLLAKVSDRELHARIADYNAEIEQLRAQRAPLLEERQRRELRASAARKLQQLTPEERAALRAS